MQTLSDFIAKVTLFPPENGGRNQPILSQQFGCVLQSHGMNHDARLSLQASQLPLNPGSTAVVPVKLLDRASVPELVVGAEFNLWELRVIGKVEVVEVHSEA